MFEVVDNENSLVDCLDYIDNIHIFNEGTEKVLYSNECTEIIERLKDVLSRGRLMPAFSVSMHEETIKAIKTGKWIKINFNRELIKNGLPFTSLLFELNTVYGMNIIREYNGSFFGRCIYIDFDEEVDLAQLSM